MEKYIYIVFLIFFLSCANVVPPEGGGKDNSPPVIIKLSTENGSINFKDRLVVLHFDENVTINNMNEVHSFPDPDLIQKINLKGREIEVVLKKELKKNTTYVIDFKKSIADLNEGNKLKGFKYVFSTGTSVDSSILCGNVTSFDRNQPVENGLVGLYLGNITDGFDSIIQSQKPYFFTFTNKNGDYRCSNLKSGTYTLMCIKDKNLNLKYELNELVSSPIVIDLKDSLQSNIKVFLDERHYLTVKKESIVDTMPEEYGLLNLFFDPSFYKKSNYLGQITKGGEVLKAFYINDSVVTINNLKNGTFQLRIVDDLNKNKKWDTGNIKTKKSPEKIYFFKDSIQIRANWELNLNIDI